MATPSAPRPAAAHYRADIDGLRAVAVLAVVFFHAGIGGFGGGYAGVDVFFVISGYLITTIVRGDLSAGGFTFGKFYERRIRRILPALYTLMLVVGVCAVILLVPQDLEDFARSVVAATLFVSNFFYWNGTSYFAAPDQTKPLLHTWSLAVEEQFYLLYPPLLVLRARQAKPRVVPILIGLLVLSLAISVWSNWQDWTAGFFLPPARAWELLLGCLIAYAPDDLVLPRALREALAGAGLAAIAIAVFVLNAETMTPLPAIALACMGAGAVIFANAGPPTFVGRMLGLRPVVWVGLISYSLYLWHWPIFVFARQVLLRPPTAPEALGLIALSVAAATASWWFVERPFRGAAGRLSRRDIFRLAGFSTVLLIGLAAGLIVSRGLPQRFSADVNAMLAYDHYNPDAAYRAGVCFVEAASDYDDGKCFVRTPGRANVLVWGDSHAAHYFYGLKAVAAAQNFTVSKATLSGCLPLTGSVSLLLRQCEAFNRRILDLIDRNRPETVVISGHWYKFYLRDPDVFLNAIRQTAATLAARHVRVVVLGAAIEYSDYLPLLITRAWAKDRHAMPDLSGQLRPGLLAFNARLKAELAGVPGATYVSILDSVCRQAHCPLIVEGGAPLIWDTAHLTPQGSTYIAQHVFAPLNLGGKGPR